MKTLMNAEDVSVTMSQPSQVSRRLGAILDTKRRRRPLGRATTLSALLLAATTVPLLAAAQSKSDSSSTVPAKADKAQQQYRLVMAGKPLWLIASTSGNVSFTPAKTTLHEKSLDIAVPSGEMVFFANSIRIDRQRFALNGNVVIAVLDKANKNKTLFQFKADSANLVGVNFPSGALTFASKSVRSQKSKILFNGNVVVSLRDRADESKVFYQFKAESATLQTGSQNP